MQKIIAIIFLFMFSAMQYGKLISYWKCKVTNSSDITAVQCDCEKILIDNNNGLDDNLSTRSQPNDKTEEWFSSSIDLATNIYRETIIKAINLRNDHIRQSAYTGHIFQPPKV